MPIRCYTCKQVGASFVPHTYTFNTSEGRVKKAFLICNASCVRKCKYCSKTGKSNTISMHMKDTHPLDYMADKKKTAYKHKCPHCPQFFTYTTHRDNHIIHNHTEASFACDECDRVTVTKYDLSVHKLDHLDFTPVKNEDGKYDCPSCCGTHTKHLLAKCLGL